MQGDDDDDDDNGDDVTTIDTRARAQTRHQFLCIVAPDEYICSRWPTSRFFSSSSNDGSCEKPAHTQPASDDVRTTHDSESNSTVVMFQLKTS